MKKKNIGILTFWDVPNYGTFAQAYALQKVCSKMCPNDEVLQIAYLDKKHYKSYYSLRPQHSIHSIMFWKELPERVLPFSKYNKKKRIFDISYNSIPHTPHMEKQQLTEQQFDIILLGSDIIWDYSFNIFNNDRFLFGLDINSNIKASYAGSFGTITTEDTHPDYVISGIKGLDCISVRDKNTKAIVERITGNECTLVLDPTWLWDFSSDANIVNPKHDNYLVVYGQDFTNEFVEEIKAYARRKNLIIICLDCNKDNYKWCDIILHQYQLSPYEWMGYFKNAECVATSTFHGLTFGLLFNRKLAFCKSDFILAKASDFLEDLGLLSVYLKSPKDIFQYIEEMDYQEINKKISLMRTTSINYLEKVLNIGNQDE